MKMTSPPTPLRFLAIGGGGILDAHLRAFTGHPDQFRLVAVADPSEAACNRIAGMVSPYGEVKAFADHKEALDNVASEVDAALVVTPHFLHFPQAKACLEAGLPVLLEKPACTTYDEALALHQLAEAKAGMVMIGQTRRYTRWAKYAHDWIREDPAHFGEPASFAIEAWQNILCWIATKPDRHADFWILDKKRAGGGVVISLGCHMLDMIRYLTGQNFAEVAAYGVYNPPFVNGAESACTATLRLENGAVGTLNANYLARRLPYSESFKLFGTKGSVVQHSAKWGQYEGEIRLGSAPEDNPPGWEFQYEGLEPVPAKSIPGYEAFLFTNQLMAFRDALLGQREPLSSLRDNLHTMAVIDAIHESMAANGKPVRVKG